MTSVTNASRKQTRCKSLKRRIEMNFRKILAVPLLFMALTTGVFADNVKTD